MIVFCAFLILVCSLGACHMWLTKNHMFISEFGENLPQISLGKFQNFKKVSSVNLSQISLLNMWLLAQMWSLDQSLVTPLFYQRSYHNLNFIRIWREKILFVFEGCFWFKFNNLELALGMAWKFYTSVAKDLKLEVRKLWRLIPTFVEFTGENC